MILALLGCATLANLLPEDPVVVGLERDAFDSFVRSRVPYAGPPRVSFPVVALPIFGVTYALDLVLVSRDPDWDMHEYARIDLPSGPMWVAKDADADRHQTITAPIEDIRTWLPEVPVSRVQGPLEVTDRSTATEADLAFRYNNPLGEPVEVHYRGPLPTEPSPKRNGNTMGHSADIAAVLLDLHLFRAGGEASIAIGGENAGIRRIFGLYPMKFLLAQTQGGFAISRATLAGSPGAAGFTLTRPDSGWPTAGTESWTFTPDPGFITLTGWIQTENAISTIRHHMVDAEIDRAEVLQAGQPGPVLEIRFNPALPDLRRPFGGESRSRFVVDVAGQRGHGVGEVRCFSDGDRATVNIVPEAPDWFAARPLEGTLLFGEERVELDVHRVEP